MAWTTPETAVAGDVLTAAWLNQNVRDNTQYLKDASDLIGLDLIYSTTLTTGSTLTTPSVFSSTYDNYMFTLDSVAGPTSMYFNLLQTSNDAAVGSWYAAGWSTSSPAGAAGVNVSNSNVATSSFAYHYALPSYSMVYVFNPFNSARTMFHFLATSFGNTNRAWSQVAAGTDTATSLHKISIVSSSGNFTAGNLKVYGIKK